MPRTQFPPYACPSSAMVVPAAAVPRIRHSVPGPLRTFVATTADVIVPCAHTALTASSHIVITARTRANFISSPRQESFNVYWDGIVQDAVEWFQVKRAVHREIVSHPHELSESGRPVLLFDPLCASDAMIVEIPTGFQT